MLIILFGPPASGKSTLLEFLENKNYNVLDIEKLGKNYKERKENFYKKLNTKKFDVDFLFVGAADLSPDDFLGDKKSIMLLPNKKIYKKRLFERKYKTKQNGLFKYDKFKKWSIFFDGFIIENNGSVEETVNKILKLIFIDK
ncbi:MAG: hypothetical protein L3J07_04670 [Candidatus Magasanikbacteria bacterium]|nr:hypothetical protein [Candidatus Magasanikbacteria bacterium]